MLTKQKKTKTIKEAAVHDKDTGSPEVQVALLSKKIDELLLISSEILRIITRAAASSRWLLTAALI